MSQSDVKKIFALLLLITPTLHAANPPSIQTPSRKATEIAPNERGAVKPTVPFNGIHIHDGKKEITLGTTGPLSGSLYKLGRDFSKTMGMVFNNVNRQHKGVHEHRIKFIIRDDEYEQASIKKNLDSIMKETSMLFGTFSSDSLYAIPEKRLNDLLVIFPDAGVSKFRNKIYTSLFFYRPSTAEEVRALISHSSQVLFKRKMAIFYEDSYWGRDGMEAAKAYIKSLGVEKAECVAIAPYVRNTVNVKNAVKIISEKAPESVICISHYRPTYDFIKQMLNEGQSKTSFMGVSETALIQEYLKKSRGIDLIATSIVPSPWKSQLPIAQSYRKEMAKYLPNLKLSSMSFEGFINAKLFVKSLEKVTVPFTKEKIVKALESYTDFDFEGLNISFDPQTRSLSKSLWINDNKYADWKIFGRKS